MKTKYPKVNIAEGFLLDKLQEFINAFFIKDAPKLVLTETEEYTVFVDADNNVININFNELILHYVVEQNMGGTVADGLEERIYKEVLFLIACLKYVAYERAKEKGEPVDSEMSELEERFVSEEVGELNLAYLWAERRLIELKRAGYDFKLIKRDGTSKVTGLDSNLH